MSEYGITPKGCVIKRLDVILDEIHGDLSEEWGFNTRQNPQSFLNVLVTDFADKIAELWEVGQNIYHAMYPFSAEGLSLDNAVQFGGITRTEARPTIYPIHAECVDGTVLPEGTLIKSVTNPEIDLQTNANVTVSRAAFNSAKVITSAVQANATYTIILDSVSYSVMSAESATAADILSELVNQINGEQFNCTTDGEVLYIAAAGIEERHSMTLSPNLTTQSVTGIVNFATLEVGDTDLPNGTITEIKTAVPGFLSVNNLIPRIAGNLQENDIELRASYISKIFQRSSRMNDSIKAAILQNVQGVSWCDVWDNPTNTYDEYNRPPHSVEAVVEGGDDTQIATQILNVKAAGIIPHGNTEVDLILNSGESLTIRFTRPSYVYVWFRVTVTTLGNLPSNYEDTIKRIISEGITNIGRTDEIAPQSFIGEMFKQIPNIAHIEIPVFYSDDPTASPTGYAEMPVPVTIRQRAVTDAARIEVILSG
ncbi:hypothetical protein AGMMS49975_08870 [Clostridia bacterium]|nr:hypothetical protein AGMMS49975_08870 [Clostridia bacterium]